MTGELKFALFGTAVIIAVIGGFGLSIAGYTTAATVLVWSIIGLLIVWVIYAALRIMWSEAIRAQRSERRTRQAMMRLRNGR